MGVPLDFVASAPDCWVTSTNLPDVLRNNRCEPGASETKSRLPSPSISKRVTPPPKAAATSCRLESFHSLFVKRRPKIGDREVPGESDLGEDISAPEASVKVTAGMVRSTKSGSAPVEAIASA